jgi:phage baseplate assembly protein V
MNLDMMKKFIRPLRDRVLLSISRAVVETIKDSGGIQTMQVSLLADEVQDDVERFQNYGLTSHPPKQSEGIMVCPGGDRSHGILIAVDNRQYRLKGLAEGEVALYTDEGDYIKLKRGNEIEISTHKLTVNATTEINMTAPTVKVNASGLFEVTCPGSSFIGPVAVTGGISSIGGGGGITSTGQVSDHTGSMDQMRSTYNGHAHNDPQGGTTGGPNNSM